MQPLGQYFLKNTSVIKKIIDSLELKSGDLVIEIGPGKGALTLPLAVECVTKNCNLIAIEKDRSLVNELLEKTIIKGAKTEIICGDALKEIKNIKVVGKVKIVGNIPYYITGNLLRILGELEKKPEIITLMIQKEVAERVTATPPKMNLLAAATQVWADIFIIANLKPGDFTPPPKVNSSIIKLIPIFGSQTCLPTGRLPEYYKLIKMAFKQPRKTLLNNLADRLQIKKEDILEKLTSLGYTEKTRAQELSIQKLFQLSEVL